MFKRMTITGVSWLHSLPLSLILYTSACINEAPRKHQQFYDLPSEQRTKVFRSYNLDEQLAIYIYDYRHIHPFDVSLGYELAERQDILPTLLQKLEQEDENNQAPLIRIIMIMCDKGYLHNRKDVIDAVQSVVSKMKKPAVKEVSLGMLDRIEARCQPESDG